MGEAAVSLHGNILNVKDESVKHCCLLACLVLRTILNKHLLVQSGTEHLAQVQITFTNKVLLLADVVGVSYV